MNEIKMVPLEADVRWSLGDYIIERIPGVACATFSVFPRGEQFAVKVATTKDEAILFVLDRSGPGAVVQEVEA